MAKKKAELQQDRDEYQARMEAARAHEAARLYGRSIDAAVSAFGYIDAMMQYELKYEAAEFNSVGAIELVLKYAPLLFRYEALDRVEGLLNECKRIEKRTAADLAQRLSDARRRMRLNHRLFSHIESYPDSRQDELRLRLGGDQEYWRATSEAWEKMGLLQRVPLSFSYRVAFVTRLGQVVTGKCPSCGHIAHAPKAMFLEQMTCTECNSRVLFVLGSAVASEAKEG